MADLEITKACAEAMGWRLTGGPCSEPAVRVEIQVELSGKGHMREFAFDPLHDDAQAMALVKKFRIDMDDGAVWLVADAGGRWVYDIPGGFNNRTEYLNRAICECVAKMQTKKEPA